MNHSATTKRESWEKAVQRRKVTDFQEQKQRFVGCKEYQRACNMPRQGLKQQTLEKQGLLELCQKKRALMPVKIGVQLDL